VLICRASARLRYPDSCSVDGESVMLQREGLGFGYAVKFVFQTLLGLFADRPSFVHLDDTLKLVKACYSRLLNSALDQRCTTSSVKSSIPAAILRPCHVFSMGKFSTAKAKLMLVLGLSHRGEPSKEQAGVTSRTKLLPLIREV